MAEAEPTWPELWVIDIPATFLGRTIGDHYGLFQSLCIGPEEYIDIGPAVHRDLLGHVTDRAEDQRCITGHFEGVIAVGVRCSTGHRSLELYGSEGDRLTGLCICYRTLYRDVLGESGAAEQQESQAGEQKSWFPHDDIFRFDDGFSLIFYKIKEINCKKQREHYCHLAQTAGLMMTISAFFIIFVVTVDNHPTNNIRL